jgi:transposase
MQILFSACAGLDVHKEKVVVCVRRFVGSRLVEEFRTFRTETNAIMEMGDWLSNLGVTHLAMESTGVFWKPIWNLLESAFELMLVNAEHIKQVPGRKTDVKDSQWIAQLLQHGLLRPSFVPQKPIRQLRDLTRQRVQLIRQKTQVTNRIHKTLEDANIKLASVASDVLGTSGRMMLQAIVQGENDPLALADMAQSRMKAKIPQLREAMSGQVEEHHRFLLRLLLAQVDFLEDHIGQVTQRIVKVMPAPFEEAIERLETIPGIDRRAAQNIVAELGADLKPFPNAGQMASWVGLCPGNHESAGKRKSGRTTKGNAWLRVVLVQCAWAATRKKDSYLAALYGRLAARRGKKRALIALAHRILTIIFSVLKKKEVYRELGPDYLEGQDKQRQAQRLLKRLKKLGFDVSVQPKEQSPDQVEPGEPEELSERELEAVVEEELAGCGV